MCTVLHEYVYTWVRALNLNYRIYEHMRVLTKNIKYTKQQQQEENYFSNSFGVIINNIY